MTGIFNKKVMKILHQFKVIFIVIQLVDDY